MKGMLNARVVECECRKYGIVESKVVESKFVEFMLHSRRPSSSGTRLDFFGLVKQFVIALIVPIPLNALIALITLIP